MKKHNSGQRIAIMTLGFITAITVAVTLIADGRFGCSSHRNSPRSDSRVDPQVSTQIKPDSIESMETMHKKDKRDNTQTKKRGKKQKRKQQQESNSTRNLLEEPVSP